MADIRINQLPNEPTPSGADFVAIDLATTRKTTVTQLTEAGRPAASQAEAEAGVNPTKAMTPLTTAQAITAQGAAQFQPVDADLTAIAALATTGILARTAAATYVPRTITGTTNEIAVTNGDGVAGNPTLALAGTAASLQSLSLQAGDLIRATGVMTLDRIPIGTNNQVLQIIAGLPTWTNVSAGGDVVGPASAVNANLASFNTTTGKLIQDSLLPTASVNSAMRGHIFGLTMSNAGGDPTNDITVAAGCCASNATLPFEMILASAITKQLDAAWAVGTNAGGRMSAAAIANTTYHVFVIRRPDTGVVDVGFDVSPTAPTLPANYTQFRRIGSIIRASAAIVLFTQIGDVFIRTTVATDRASTAALADSLITISVPTGIIVSPIFNLNLTPGLTTNVNNAIGSGFMGAVQATAQVANSQAAGGGADVSDILSGVIWTNTSAQIRFRVIINSGSLIANTWITLGWIDTREVTT